MKRITLALTAYFLLISPVTAGPQYLINGLALDGYDPVAYFEQGEAVKGSPEYSYQWNNATWHFSSARNRSLFGRTPERFAPAYDGHCAYGTALDGKVPGDPLVWTIYEGRLYVNITPRVQGWWEKDIPKFLGKSEVNWSHLENRDAATNLPPRLR